MEMEQSLRDSLNQLIALQSQQLQAINNLSNSTRATDLRVQQMNSSMTQSPMFMSSYNNYNPNYMPPMFPFSQNTIQAQNNFGNYMGQLTGPKFFDSIFVNPSRVSNEQRNLMAADIGSNMSNAFLSGGAVVGGLAADFGTAAMMPGLISGVAAGTVVGGLAGGLFDIGLQQNRQHLAINRYLMRESYRFINPLESNNTRSVGGFNQSERFELAKYLRGFNVQEKITDDETMTLLQKFTEGGMLKDVKDMETFRNKMTQLTKYVKKSALMLNETFEEVSDLMAEMQKSGISATNFDLLASRGKIVGAYTGMSGSEALRFMYNSGQTITQGTAFSPVNGVEMSANNLLYVNALYESAKKQRGPGNPIQTEIANLIANNPQGVQGTANMMAQYQVQLLNNPTLSRSMIGFFDYNAANNGFTFNRETFNRFLKGEATFDEISRAAANKLNDLPVEAKNNWMQNRTTYLMNSLTDDQMKMMLSRSLLSMKSGSNLKDSNLSMRDMLSMFLGQNSQEAKLYGDLLQFYIQDGGNLGRVAGKQSMKELMLADVNSQRVGVYHELRNKWEGFKDKVGNVFTPVGEWFTKKSQDLSDWWYGKEYTIEDMPVGKGRGWSKDEVHRLGQNLTTTLMQGVQDGLKDAKGRGFDVRSEVVNMFKVDQSTLSDWKSKVISYQREIYKDIEGVSTDIRKYFDTIKQSSKEALVSETTVAGLLRYGALKGTGTMGLGNVVGSDILNKISEQLGVRAYGAASEEERIRIGSRYLGNLNTAYGGNQELALAAYFTSQEVVDKALKASGAISDTMDILRKQGYQNSVRSIKYQDIKNFMPKDVQEDINRVINKPSTMDDYNEQLKRGLGDKKDINQIIREEAERSGISKNFLASVVAAESSGNTDESTAPDYGLTQLTSGFVNNYIKNFGDEIVLADGTKMRITQNNWKFNPRLNVAIAANSFNRYLGHAGNNPYLAYAMWNAGPAALDWAKQELAARGTKPEDMLKALGNLTKDEVAQILIRNDRQDKANALRDNFSRQLEQGGIEPPKQETTTKEEVLTDNEGKLLNDAKIEEYNRDINKARGAMASNYIDFASFKEMYQKDIEISEKAASLGIDSSNRDRRASATSYRFSTLQKEFKKGFAKMYNVDYKEGDPKSEKGLRDVVMKKYKTVVDMINEYRDAPKNKRNLTQWGKLSYGEKIQNLKILEWTDTAMGTFYGQENYSSIPGGDINNLLTGEDMIEATKVRPEGEKEGTFQLYGKKIPGITTGEVYEKGFFGKKNLGVEYHADDPMSWQYDPQRSMNLYLKYITEGGAYKGKTGIGDKYTPVNDIVTNLEGQLKDLEIQKNARLQGNTAFLQQIIKGEVGGIKIEDKEAKSLMEAVLMSGDDKDIKALQTYRQKLSGGAPTEKISQLIDVIDRAIGSANKIKDLDLEGLKEAIEGFKKLKSLGEDVGQIGTFLLKQIGAKEDIVDVFKKSFSLTDEEKKNLSADVIEKRVTSASQQIEKYITQNIKEPTEEFKKGLEGILGTSGSESFMSEYKKALEGGTEGADKVSKLVTSLLEAIDASDLKARETMEKNKSEASQAAQDLDLTYKRLVDQVVVATDSMVRAYSVLSNKMTDLSSKVDTSIRNQYLSTFTTGNG